MTSQIWEVSTGIQTVNTSGTYLTNRTYRISPFENKCLLYIASFGANIPIYRIKEELVLGAQANIYINAPCKINEDGNSPAPQYGLGAPGYLTLRYGGGSRKNSDKIIGCGIGIGYKLNSLFADLGTENDNDDGMYLFWTPTFMAEISFDRNHKAVIFDNFKFRFEVPFSSHRINYYYKGYEYYYDFKQASFTFVICY